MANKFGIDLGTSTISIYNHSKKSFMTEKNMIAIANKNQLFAYGDSAYDMYEKAPANIVISYPLNNGVIADINNMQLLLRHFIEDCSEGDYKNADYYIAVPTDVTEVEQRAFYELVKDSNMKPHNIYMIDKAIADGVGLGVDVKNSQGVMVVNVGFQTTEISILSLGGIVLSKLIKNGGLRFDDSIRNCVRKEYNLHIGRKSSEQIKMNLADLKKDNKNAIVYGRDVMTGLPMEREVSTKIIDDCLKENFMSIIDNIKLILEKTPPELGADIYRNGLYITGGGSLVSNFGEMVANSTGLRVNMAESAIESCIGGISEIISNKKLKSLAHTIGEIK